MKSERGVALILSGFALILGLWGLLTLAWLPLVHRNARIELQILADGACIGAYVNNSPGLVSQIPFQSQMWNSFKGKLQVARRRYVEVTSATLFLATPPEDTSQSSSWPFSPSPGIASGVKSFVPSGGACIVDGIARLVTSFEPQEADSLCASVQDVLPINAANNIRNFGNTAVCYLEGRVRDEIFGISLSFLGGSGLDRVIRVTSGSWAPVRGINSSPPLPNPAPGASLDVTNSPGMFLAIAPQIPQLDDGAVADRFRFPDGHLLRTGDFDIESMPNCANLVSDSSKGPKRAFACVSSSKLVSNDGRLLPETPLPVNQLVSRRYACSNPLILARNIFSSSLASLAARHGQLRQMLEVGVVNSIVYKNGVRITIEPAPPALLRTALNDDIFQAQTRLPYLYLIFPNLVDNIFTPLDSVRDLERIVTSQLAQCEHLYSGMDANFPSFSALNEGFTAINNSFQSEDYNSLFDGTPRPQNLFDPNWHWEANVDLASDFNFTAISNTNDVNSRIFQTLMTLGAVKLCPYIDPGFPAPCNAVQSDFRAFPDLEGILNYLSDPDGLAFSVNRVGISERIPPAQGVAGIETRRQDYNFPLTTVVMHEIPPDALSLQNLIENYSSPTINSIIWPNSRPLHFVIFPSGSIDPDLLTVFTETLVASGPRRFLNSVTVIWPCETRADMTSQPRYPNFCDNNGNLLVGNWGDKENLWRSFWLALAGESVNDISGNIITLPEKDRSYGRALEFFRTRVTRASNFL